MRPLDYVPRAFRLEGADIAVAMENWIRGRFVCSGVEVFVQETGLRNGAFGADKFGFKDLAAVHWNLLAPQLYEHAIAAGEASIVQGGAMCAETGVHTGRSPKDKHTVVDGLTENTVWWGGNRKLSKASFQLLLDDFLAHARGKKLYAQDLYG